MNDYLILNLDTGEYVVSAKYNSYWKENYVVLHDQIEPPPSYEKFEVEYTKIPEEAQVFYSIEKAMEFKAWLKTKIDARLVLIEYEKAEEEYLKEGLCL